MQPRSGRGAAPVLLRLVRRPESLSQCEGLRIDWPETIRHRDHDRPGRRGIHGFSNVTHTYLDNPSGGGTYTIAVTVNTSDEQSTTASVPVAVTNVVPALSGITLSTPTLNEGDDLTLSGTVVDPGVLDSHTVVITWGDGLLHLRPRPWISSPANLNSRPHAAISTTRAVMRRPDSYPITIDVTGQGRRRPGARAPAVTVANVPPTVAMQGLLR